MGKSERVEGQKFFLTAGGSADSANVRLHKNVWNDSYVS